METIPDGVLDRVTGIPGSELLTCAAASIEGGAGAATGGVARLTGTYRAGSAEGAFTLVRKEFRPLTSGRHAEASRRPDHWAYWRREPNAYTSGLLPRGPGLRAPAFYGTDGSDVLFLEHVSGSAEDPATAARRLGRWQATAAVPSAPWLAGHQLAQRLAVTELDWSGVDADPRMAKLWERRAELLDSLADVPVVLTHGDFHPLNLLSSGGDTVVLDWGTLGVAPVGADLAHLMLGCQEDLLGAYLDGLGGHYAEADVRAGVAVTLGLTGASRVHWMLAAGVPVPDGYEEFIASVTS